MTDPLKLKQRIREENLRKFAKSKARQAEKAQVRRELKMASTAPAVVQQEDEKERRISDAKAFSSFDAERFATGAIPPVETQQAAMPDTKEREDGKPPAKLVAIKQEEIEDDTVLHIQDSRVSELYEDIEETEDGKPPAELVPIKQEEMEDVTVFNNQGSEVSESYEDIEDEDNADPPEESKLAATHRKVLQNQQQEDEDDVDVEKVLEECEDCNNKKNNDNGNKTNWSEYFESTPKDFNPTDYCVVCGEILGHRLAGPGNQLKILTRNLANGKENPYRGRFRRHQKKRHCKLWCIYRIRKGARDPPWTANEYMFWALSKFIGNDELSLEVKDFHNSSKVLERVQQRINHARETLEISNYVVHTQSLRHKTKGKARITGHEGEKLTNELMLPFLEECKRHLEVFNDRLLKCLRHERLHIDVLPKFTVFKFINDLNFAMSKEDHPFLTDVEGLLGLSLSPESPVTNDRDLPPQEPAGKPEIEEEANEDPPEEPKQPANILSPHQKESDVRKRADQQQQHEDTEILSAPAPADVSVDGSIVGQGYAHATPELSKTGTFPPQPKRANMSSTQGGEYGKSDRAAKRSKKKHEGDVNQRAETATVSATVGGCSTSTNTTGFSSGTPSNATATGIEAVDPVPAVVQRTSHICELEAQLRSRIVELEVELRNRNKLYEQLMQHCVDISIRSVDASFRVRQLELQLGSRNEA